MSARKQYPKVLHLCIYCGSIATDRDHLVPIGKWGRKPGRGSKSKTVPACRMCNNCLGDISISDVRGRARHLATKYPHRYDDESLLWLKKVALLVV